MSSWLQSIYRGIYDGLAQRGPGSLDSPMKIAAGDIRNGDVNIMTLKAYKSDGQAEADYKDYVTEFHIFESIVSPAVYCTLTIKDAVNMAEYFRLGIGDLVHIKFQTPGTEACEYVFKVNTPEISKTRSPSLTFDVYTAELVSVAAIAAFEDVRADMEGFDLKDTAGNIIKNILDEKITPLQEVRKAEQLREKAVGHYIDTGHGIIGRNTLQTSRLPRNSNGVNRKPFEVIHQLALLNNISPEGHSLYTFFEREDGYWFKPIEKLIEDGKRLHEQGQSDKIFYYDHLRNQDASAVKFRNILAFSILNNDGRDGHVITESKNINPDTGEITAPTSPSDEDINITSLTSAQTLNEFANITRSDVTTSTEYDHLNRLIVQRRRLLSRISQFEAQVMIYGDTNMAAGDVIECNFPQATGAVQENVPSKDSGFYLVTHLRHMILNTDRPQHAISCSLMRAEPPRSLL